MDRIRRVEVLEAHTGAAAVAGGLREVDTIVRCLQVLDGSRDELELARFDGALITECRRALALIGAEATDDG